MLQEILVAANYNCYMQGIQLLLVFSDCAVVQFSNLCTVNTDIVIDIIPINIRTAVGMSIPPAAYNGRAGLAVVNASIEVRCADSFYGPDCLTQCSNFVNCAACGLPGLTGQFCQFNVDNCTDAYCNGNGECIDGSTMCNCAPGFTGDRCETNIDDCVGAECNNGTCVDKINDFRCECDPGFTGDRCEDIDDCVGAECNDGTCVDEVDTFRCECNSGFTGDRCETDIDFCKEAICNNGICVEENAGFRCNCNPGFTGDHCQGKISIFHKRLLSRSIQV